MSVRVVSKPSCEPSSRSNDKSIRNGQLASVIASSRVDAARQEQERFEAFATRLGLPLSADAVTVFLTASLATADSPRSLRRRLAKLDLAARLDGQAPWSRDATLQYYLRGLHRQTRIGPTD